MFDQDFGMNWLYSSVLHRAVSVLVILVECGWSWCFLARTRFIWNRGGCADEQRGLYLNDVEFCHLKKKKKCFLHLGLVDKI